MTLQRVPKQLIEGGIPSLIGEPMAMVPFDMIAIHFVDDNCVVTSISIRPQSPPLSGAYFI
ncbi:MAG: hypothetical protein WED00_04650 [Aquisalimonadaceae bacterium]